MFDFQNEKFTYPKVRVGTRCIKLPFKEGERKNLSLTRTPRDNLDLHIQSDNHIADFAYCIVDLLVFRPVHKLRHPRMI